MRRFALVLGGSLFVALATLGMAIPGLASLPQEQDKGLKGREGDTVTFDLKSSIIFAQGTINGRGPFTFIVDTGASVTVLRPATAEKLGITAKKNEGEGGLGRIFRSLGSLFGAGVQIATVESIGLGKALVKDLPVAVMMVPQADVPLGMLGITYDGILGYNYLSQFVTTFDYKKRSIGLAPNDYTPEDPTQALRRAAEPKKEEPPPGAPSVPGAYVGFTYRETAGGIEIRKVASQSPAEKGGLRAGDVVREINGTRVESGEAYRKRVAGLKAGETVTFTVVRGGREERLQVVVSERP